MSIIQDSVIEKKPTNNRMDSMASFNQTILGDKNYQRQTMGTTNAISSRSDDPIQAQQLRQHLENAQPFNGLWLIKQFLNSGAYGSVIAVESKDGNQAAVLKVSKGDFANKQANWEADILTRIQERNPSANVVRVIDNGTLESPDGDELKFLAIEKCDQQITQYLTDKKGPERQKAVCEVMLGLLKGLYDIHSLGILHRDFKAMNAGLVNDSDGKIKVLLYDFGNARYFTNEKGELSFWIANQPNFKSSHRELRPTSVDQESSQAIGPTTCVIKPVGTTSFHGSTWRST